MNVDLIHRAGILAAVGDPVRLAVVEALQAGDLSPGELSRQLQLPGNLMAHHLKVLEEAGVVQRNRSDSDRRRTFVRLVPQSLNGLLPSVSFTVPRVVFVCTHNSARSRLAAAAWRRRSRVPATSAGTSPAAAVHPKARTVADRHGLRLDLTRPRQLSTVLRPDDLVVAVCDSAHEELSRTAATHLHWSVPDPAGPGTDRAFELAYQQVDDRVSRLAPIVRLERGATR